ncbi:MAG: hypothetical protein N3E36_02020 [Sulfolobales archaeon]|nr:hypothetical protein [Sulfolobales archaeon]MCX8198791.1 hypothetical protein [Sulfolobales archaeon]MDW8169864.1 hypothetical protein [Desulfurococcaceae archaeon]
MNKARRRVKTIGLDLSKLTPEVVEKIAIEAQEHAFNNLSKGLGELCDAELSISITVSSDLVTVTLGVSIMETDRKSIHCSNVIDGVVRDVRAFIEKKLMEYRAVELN